MNAEQHNEPQPDAGSRRWECSICGAQYASVWLARECHDPMLERDEFH